MERTQHISRNEKVGGVEIAVLFGNHPGHDPWRKDLRGQALHRPPVFSHSLQPPQGDGQRRLNLGYFAHPDDVTQIQRAKICQEQPPEKFARPFIRQKFATPFVTTKRRLRRAPSLAYSASSRTSCSGQMSCSLMTLQTLRVFAGNSEQAAAGRTAVDKGAR